MEFGLFLATIDFDAVRDSARLAEELGYHLLVFPDHFVHEGPSGYDPHTIAHDPILLSGCRRAGDPHNSNRTRRAMQSLPSSHGDGAGPDVARPSERRTPGCRSRRRMDRDRVPNDRDPLSRYRYAACECSTSRSLASVRYGRRNARLSRASSIICKRQFYGPSRSSSLIRRLSSAAVGAERCA